MSYRTYVNETQLFGNNECYDEWLDFIRTQEIEVDEECYYEGDISDVIGAIRTLESIVLNMEQKQTDSKSLFDLSDIPKTLKEQDLNDPFNNSMLDLILTSINSYYCFLPYVFYRACKDMLEQETPFSIPGRFYCWKLKPGCKIHVKAN